LKSIVAPFRTLSARRELIWALIVRELRDRHAGQALGAVWAYGHPLILMVFYTVLFAYVFPSRYGSSVAGADYSVCVLIGILSWLAFQDILSRAPSILLAHASLVKQIVFPTEVLPVKTAIASLLPYSVGLVFAIGAAAYHHTLSWMILAIPLLATLQLIAMTGVALLLSPIGVFIRDLREFVSVFCTLNLFAQPILYNPFSLPHALSLVLAANPFSYLVWCWQDAIFHGEFYHPYAWLVLPILSVGIFVLGWVVFERARHQLGDAL
jgi:lipopolysaccharide transport system permease protein